jgi:hypothetical protein
MLDVTQASYPSQWYTNSLVDNQKVINLTSPLALNASFFQATLLMINVFYNEMIYTKIEDAPALTVDVFIALIGGNLGLFWGASLLTLTEAVEIIFYVVYLGIINRNNQNNVHP